MGGITLHTHGCRGSSPVAGADFDHYGGLTTCFEIVTGSDRVILVDAGTGIHSLLNSRPADTRYSIFLTHVHWDHIQGLPFFTPLYDPDADIEFYGRPVDGLSIAEAIEGVMKPPFFPVSFLGSASRKRYPDLDGGARLGDLAVGWTALYHPSGVTGYRFEKDGRVLVIATDVEAGDADSDRAVRQLAAGADVLVHDAQYLPDEYAASKTGWGHSTWEHAVAVAVDAGVGQLVLTSHDPDRTDAQVEAIVTAARSFFPNTLAAYTGMSLQV